MSKEITTILNRLAAGHADAMAELVPLVYEQMRIIADSAARREQPGICEPTELVHEAYIRLVGNEKLAWQSRSHFFGACATVIRRILVDQARKRQRQKRGGDWKQVQLEDGIEAPRSAIDLLELENALAELEQLAPRQVRLIELRYFGGLSETEVAEVLQLSRRTVTNDWAMAKAWLKVRLEQ